MYIFISDIYHKGIKNYFIFLISFLFFANVFAEETRTFKPSPIKRLCPKHVKGDREFDGHGPDVRTNVRLSISRNKRNIVANISLTATETMRNWTTAKGSWSRNIWTAPSGYQIVRILSSKSSSASYRDSNHHIDRPRRIRGRLVKTFEIMGDTRGNDVGNCTSDDVFLSVFFNRIKVLIKSKQVSCPTIRVFRPQTIKNLCPRHVRGDREFDGHGPDVKASVQLRLSSNKRNVMAIIKLSATETMRDWTTARRTWKRKIWTAPEGCYISRILSSRYSKTYYRDNNHHIDYPQVRSGNLVNKFRIMGDTRGNDVRNCTSDDVFMDVIFNKVKVKMRQ